MSLLTIDIGGTTVKWGLVKGKKIHEVADCPTPTSWPAMQKLFKQIKTTYEPGLSGVAISSPGAYCPSDGVIHGKSALSYIHEFPIVNAFESLLGLPVTLENDANCTGYAETRFGVATSAPVVVCIVLGTGVGGSIFINGKLLRGVHNYAGEFGGVYCRDGTLMGTATPIMLGQEYTRQRACGKRYTGRDVFTLADEGDGLAIQLTNQLLQRLVDGITCISHVIDPNLIVIGGAISENAQFIHTLQLRLNERAEQLEMPELNHHILAAKFHGVANLIGAATVFGDQYPEIMAREVKV